MLSKISFLAALCLALLGISAMATNARAGSTVSITATLTPDCPNCGTDVGFFSNTTGSGGVYSLLPDASGSYTQTSTVESQILNHNTVYTLNTMSTLVNGLVGPDTRTVNMHFFSTVAGSGSDNLPACWGIGNEGDISQAVNWSIFSANSQSFLLMTQNTIYPGQARLDFNVRPECDNQVYRFYLEWSNLTILRQSTNPNTWVVTSAGPCNDYDTDSDADNCGTASLYGQGGKKQTFYYGDWRVPFQITLTEQ